MCIRTTPRGAELVEEAWDANSKGKLRMECSDWYLRGDVHTIGWDEVKWDSFYPEVAAVDELLQVEGLQGEP